jgi:hypothetical protein
MSNTRILIQVRYYSSVCNLVLFIALFKELFESERITFYSHFSKKEHMYDIV